MKFTAPTALLVLCMLAPGCSGGDDDAADLPVLLSFPKSLAIGFEHPTGSPPGADDPACRPSADHPRPVVLVHGTFNNRASTWNALAPLLKNKGYCVFSLNFGARRQGSAVGAVTAIDGSAQKLARFVDDVLRLTAADKVDIVGYSQGGMMPRQYLRFHGGVSKVASLIALAPSNHGTNGRFRTLLNDIAQAPGPLRGMRQELVAVFIGKLRRLCPACEEQLAGSRFLERLNAPPEALPGIRYTVISSKYDQVLTPYKGQFLAGSDVSNITLQDKCNKDLGDDLSMPFDQVALHYVTNALDPTHATRAPCVAVVPSLGG